MRWGSSASPQLGDWAAVRVLAELISGCARLHAEGRVEEVAALWERSVEAIAEGEAAVSRRQ